MPRDNKSKRMYNSPTRRKQIHEDIIRVLKIEKTKLHKQLDECVDMLDRILLHVDVGYTNPSMETEIKEFLKKIR